MIYSTTPLTDRQILVDKYLSMAVTMDRLADRYEPEGKDVKSLRLKSECAKRKAELLLSK